MTPSSDKPTAQAQSIMERLLSLVRECRLVLRSLEHPPEPGETSSTEAERPLGPMGAEWLERQAGHSNETSHDATTRSLHRG